LVLAAIATPFIVITTLLGLWVSAATSKIDLIREIKRVYSAINYRKKPCIPGKLMWAVYNAMTPEEKSLQGVSAFGDTRLVQFINILLQNKPAADLTPDDVDEISERLECWDHAQAAVAEKRVQKAIARALAQYQNYMLTAEMVRRNEELQQNGDVEEEEQENVTVEEVLMDNRADITSQTQDQADSNADAIGGDDEGNDEHEEEEEEEEEGDLVDDLADTEGMLDDAAGEMEADTGADEGDDSDPMEDLSAQLKIVTSHFQVLGGGGKSLGLKWPGTAAGLMKLANYFNIDVFAIFSIDCMERYNYYDKLHAFLFVPVFFVLMMLSIYFILKLTTSIDLDMIKNFAWSKFIILMFLLYPILCTQLLGVFDCREIDGHYWLKKDLTIECYTDEWTSEAIMSAVFIVIFPLGVPAAVYFVLSRNRHRLNIDAKFKSRLGFIYSRYEEWFWFWEVTEMLRKFIICGLMIFISPGTMLQLCFSILTGAFFLSIHFKFQPFDDDLDDNLQTAALLASFLTLVTTVLVRANEDGPSVTFFILFVNLGVLATAMYALVQDTFPSMIEEYTAYYDQAISIKETLEAAAEEFEELDGFVEATESPVVDAVAATSATTVIKSAATDPGSTEKTSAEEPSDLEKQIQRLFLRYDLDGSGTINSFDELEQLCCNLGYRLELDLNPSKIDVIIAGVKADTPTINWDLPTFSTWFKSTFLEGSKEVPSP